MKISSRTVALELAVFARPTLQRLRGAALPKCGALARLSHWSSYAWIGVCPSMGMSKADFAGELTRRTLECGPPSSLRVDFWFSRLTE